MDSIWRFEAKKVWIALLLASLVLAGCASHRASSSVDRVSTSSAAPTETKALHEIIYTEEDITDQNYEVIADIEASVSKSTIFNSDPTQGQVKRELLEQAQELGADAVILVRYGSVGVSAFSWGSLEGNGRAVRFVD